MTPPPETFSHMIPLPKQGQRILSRIAPFFGSKAVVVELGIQWGIRNSTPEFADLPPKPQIHVHLTDNYRARFTPTHLGSMLLASLTTARFREIGDYQEPDGVWYWGVDLPTDLVNEIRKQCFEAGRNPTAQIAEQFRAALETVRLKIPTKTTHAPTVYVDVPTDPATRRLYASLADIASANHLDMDTMLVEAMRQSTRKGAMP